MARMRSVASVSFRAALLASVRVLAVKARAAPPGRSRGEAELVRDKGFVRFRIVHFHIVDIGKVRIVLADVLFQLRGYGRIIYPV
mgnify:CR=1 FL=1